MSQKGIETDGTNARNGFHTIPILIRPSGPIRPAHQNWNQSQASKVFDNIMSTFPSDIAFTPSVKAIQSAKSSRASYAKMEQSRGWQTTITPELVAFLAEMDMFYLGTANADGQPYIQYRGGPPGFLRVIDESTLGFADFGGNRQYITLGNLQDNSKAFIFLMDYIHSRRIKLWGTARVVEGDLALQQQLADPAYPGKVERAIVFQIEAWDVNCPQHIHKRFPQKAVAPVIEQLQSRIAQLEQQLHDLSSSKPFSATDSHAALTPA